MVFYRGTQTVLISIILIIPSVFSNPLPQQNEPPYEYYEPDNSPSKSRLLYWIFGIVGIAVFMEIIYWIYRCFSLVRKGNNIQSSNVNNDGITRRRGLFDTPSYAGSIDEQLPPYESFSLPKYNNIINECETIQVVEVNSDDSDTNDPNSIDPNSNSQSIQSQFGPFQPPSEPPPPLSEPPPPLSEPPKPLSEPTEPLESPQSPKPPQPSQPSQPSQSDLSN